MKAWLVLAAAVAASPGLATSAAPLGKFGDWDLWSDPPMLPPVGQPMPPMRYSATFGASWTSRWGAESRISFGPEGAVVTTFGGECSLRERVAAAGSRSHDPEVLRDMLLRQARHVESCVHKAGGPKTFQRQMRASMPDLTRMLKRVREVARSDQRVKPSAANPSARRGER